MRFVKSATIGLFLLLMLAGEGALGQAAFDCGDILPSTKDTVFIPFTEGRPGDTVLIPIYMANDSIVTSFQVIFEYDTTYLTPVFIRASVCAIFDGTDCLTWDVAVRL